MDGMDTFVALADPTRRHIIESLALGESSFGDLANQFEMSPPAVSQHLKVLRNAGLVTARDRMALRFSVIFPGFSFAFLHHPTQKTTQFFVQVVTGSYVLLRISYRFLNL